MRYDYNDYNPYPTPYGGWDEEVGYGFCRADWAVGPTDPPSNIYITVDNYDHPVLHWTRPEAPDEKSYRIKRVIDGSTDYFYINNPAQTSWTDTEIFVDPSGPTPVIYRVTAKDITNFWSPYSDAASTTTGLVPVSLGNGSELIEFDPLPHTPIVFDLMPVSPNPFNARTSISFCLPKQANVKIQIFDITGRLVQELANNPYSQGGHTLTWDASSVSSGVYFVVASLGSETFYQKLSVIK